MHLKKIGHIFQVCCCNPCKPFSVVAILNYLFYYYNFSVRNLWKIGVRFSKMGVCFIENGNLFYENGSLFSGKWEFVFWKMGVCSFRKWEFLFYENGSLSGAHHQERPSPMFPWVKLCAYLFIFIKRRVFLIRANFSNGQSEQSYRFTSRAVSRASFPVHFDKNC